MMTNIREKMKITRHHIRAHLNVLVIFVLVTVIATLFSYLIAWLIRILEVDLNRLTPIFHYPADLIPSPYNLSGLLVIVLGIGLNFWANYMLIYADKVGFKARYPFQMPSTLVVDGPFRFSRNPVYLSVLLILLGVVILLSSLMVFIVLIAIFVIFQIWFISWEEKKLEEVFGNDYLEYKQRVSRWL